jgi:uncharacterized cupredoxin-like copper-binding protein
MTLRSLPMPVPRLPLILALALITLPGLSNARAYPEEAIGLPAAALYVAEGSSVSTLAPLDAATLENRNGAPTASVGAIPRTPILSADGSTLAYLDADATIVVRDGLYGPECLRFFPDADVGALSLSRDGRRLVAEVIADYSDANLRTPAWKVFDSVDGRLLATVENAEPGDQWGIWAVDADALRLYRLAYDGGTSTPAGPRSTRLIANDLSSGAEIDRIELPEIFAGFWQSDEVVAIGDAEEPLMKELTPALAISSDGSRIAIAHADEAELTVIDTARLAVERTVSLARPVSALRMLLGHLSLMPQSASAKAMEGTRLQAVFAPDGKRLYLTGAVSSIEEGELIYRGLGLRAINVDTGEIAAEAFADELIERVVPSADGGSLYIFGPESSDFSAGYQLRRLDTAELHVVAERTFPDWRWFLVRSTLAEPAEPLTIELVEMELVPELVTIPANVEVRLVVVNHGTTRHTFRTGDEAGTWNVRVDLAPGESTTVTLNAPAGEFKAYCDVAGHAEAGMGGAIIAR